LTMTVNGRTGPTINLDASDVGAIPTTDIGSAGGVAALDSSGHIPNSQLPSTPDFSSVTISLLERPLPSPQNGTLIQVCNANSTITRVELDSYAAASHFSAMRYGGTLASPTALASGNEIGSFNGWGYNGTAIEGPSAALRCYAAENWATGHQGTYWAISVTPIGSTTLTDAWYVGPDGGFYANGVTGGDLGVGSCNATILAEGGIRAATRKRTAVADANYTASVTDRSICYTALTAERTVTLPSAAGYPPEQAFWVVDETGLASSTLQLIASPAGSDTIAGLASGNSGLPAVGSPYGRLALFSNGSNLWTY
jgi:hypothetical protein